MIVEEKIIPEPQPKGFFLLLGCVFIFVHIIEIARVNHRRTADIQLIGWLTKVLTDAVQEIVELNVQLLHLDALVLLDVLNRQPVDLLPLDALGQPKTPRNIEHLEIRVQLANVDIIVAGLIEIDQECTHTGKVVLCVPLERTAVNMCVSIAKEECQIVDADKEPCE